ncbi:Uncharacterised protein [Burkholderia pseudomallei]|uniref:hypothetical protein n=1 Tax=Burkholderia glumae TaxID=337 RepID=UPI002037580D|nr:hypothetical protein [Burkholderia glumae]MCM2547370.1 hypothetical protein [Burkholderia glumae]CAJ8786583.1 Uncharacterised protein [Burkholderia pseudomallei]
MFDSSKKYWFSKNDDHNTQKRKKQRFVRNQITGLDAEEAMFEQRKSYQVLFTTLNVKERYREDVNFRTMQRLRDTLFQRIRDARDYARSCRIKEKNRTILHDIHGLIWRQECGEDGGSHHVHLVVFVSVSRRDHVTACEELGLAWERITKWGGFHNGNRYARSYRNKWGVAVGYVHRDDDEKREALRKVIGLYMAKVTQMPADCHEHGNLFGTRRFGRE